METFACRIVRAVGLYHVREVGFQDMVLRDLWAPSWMSPIGPKPEWRPSSGDIRSWGNSGLAGHRVRMAALDPKETNAVPGCRNALAVLLRTVARTLRFLCCQNGWFCERRTTASMSAVITG